MTVLPLFPRRRRRADVIELAAHRRHVAAIEAATRAAERARTVEWLAGRAAAARLDADHAAGQVNPDTPPPVAAAAEARVRVYRLVAVELDCCARDLEDPT